MHIDYDPYLNNVSSDTQEQSGHTPPDYNTVYPTALNEAPSPAKEDSTEDDGIRLQDLDAVDLAELEWLIHNAPLADNADNANAGRSSTTDDQAAIENHKIEMLPTMIEGIIEDAKSPTQLSVVEANNTPGQEEVRIQITSTVINNAVVTPAKQSTDTPRRSARITNRSGPVVTVERYKIAAKKKGLELQAEICASKNAFETREREVASLKAEDWERVAEGAGYIISPKNKASISSFIKGSMGPLA